jgi:hypothetical protein
MTQMKANKRRSQQQKENGGLGKRKEKIQKKSKARSKEGFDNTRWTNQLAELLGMTAATRMSKKLARPCDNLLSEIRTKAWLSREISEKGGRPTQNNEKPFPIDAPNVQNALVVN